MDGAFRRDRLKALVHFVCAKVGDPSLLGSVKLNKVLWYTDLASFIETGQSVTGARYIKKPHGPVASELAPILAALVEEGALKVETRSRHGHSQTQYVSQRDPDTSVLDYSDMWHAEEVLERITKNYTATKISEVSHNHPWRVARDEEHIPFEAIYAAVPLEIDQADMQWARKVTGCGA